MGSAAHRFRIFLVGHVFHPLDMRAIERFLHRDMDHAGVRPGAVPMLLVRRNPDCVAGLDLADRSAFRLHTTDTRYDVQRLPERMRMPRRARAGLEAYAARAD